MNCLRCEIKRAKLITAGLLIVGKSKEEIAAHLSATFGEQYFVSCGSIYRASKLYPFEAHLIKE